MENAQQFSSEMLGLLLQKSDQIIDFVQLLLLNADEASIDQKAILQQVGLIRDTTAEINLKMDTVLEKLTKLGADFEDLKSENRDVEQKIVLMVSKLSKLESSISDSDIEEYIDLTRTMYDNWDDLDDLTKKFIPLAEYLYSKLQKIDKADYSPVILELCRAIENEFLLKIFSKYTADLLARQGSNLDAFLAADRSSDFLKDKTGLFVKAISKAAKTRRAEYTLGQMNTILSILNDQRALALSPLLQDFKQYLQHNTEAQSLLKQSYIDKINDIVSNYRNPSAHPEFMKLEKAKKCREIMPERLDYLMECVNQ